MRKLALLFVSISVIGFAACNSQTGGKNSATTDSTQTHEMSHNQMAVAASTALPPIPDSAKVYFKNLKNGQDVTSPFKVEMGVAGMTVEPAGQVKAGTDTIIF